MTPFKVGNLIGINFLKPNSYTAVIYNSNYSQNGEVVEGTPTIRAMSQATLIELTLELIETIPNIRHDWNIVDSTEVTIDGIRYMIIGITVDTNVLIIKLVPWDEI